MNYKGNILGGALLVRESKIIADLLTNNISQEDFKNAIEVENILQTKTVSSSKKYASVIRKRFALLSNDFLKILCDADNELATQICLCGFIKQNRLFGDYLIYIVKDYYKLGKEILDKYSWYSFIEELKISYPDDLNFSESSSKKIASVVFTVLSQSRFIEDTKKYKLIKFYPRNELMTLLHKENENYLIECLEICK